MRGRFVVPKAWVRSYDTSCFHDLQYLIVIFCVFVCCNKNRGVFMDIMLERILSLIPRKPDGKFVHGALKEFANTVGLKSGNLVSDWMNGRSTSYKSYIYEIAAKYSVSVEWLKGESDQKEKSPTPEGVELDEETIQLKEIWDSADQEERDALLAMAKMLKARRNK